MAAAKAGPAGWPGEAQCDPDGPQPGARFPGTATGATAEAVICGAGSTGTRKPETLVSVRKSSRATLHFRHTLKAFFAIFAQAVRDHPFQFRRHRGLMVLGRGGSVRRIADRTSSLERRRMPVPREHFMQQQPEFENVAASIHRLAHGLFRRHIGRAAHHHAFQRLVDIREGLLVSADSVWFATWIGMNAAGTGSLSFATPKSRIFTRPRGVTMTLAGLKSR